MPKVEKYNNLQQNTVPLVSTAKLGYLQGLSFSLKTPVSQATFQHCANIATF